MLLDFSGKTIAITGASRGIGLAVAKAFHAAGATLHLLADDPAVESVAAKLSARGHVADVADAASLAAAFENIEGLDVLINNAGVERMTPILEWSPAIESDFRRILEVNVLGTARVTALALPRMAGGSAIINTASIWGRVAEPLFGAYVASKHAVIGLTKTFARELGPKGIRVNAVCPGWVRTDAAMASLARMSVRSNTDQEEMLSAIVGAQALPGLMAPADIIGPYLFLASPLAANITGQTIGIDRGEVPW
ncbi:SDR family oxidoreductase [Rhizobium sp. BK376]|uniref:SDR family NAD(P)-dependent oxidoreductase n=1 Tax=Rhizobium sp. BK376 TaxID=2512149 RepID=UPI00104EC965|nr:SDR family oxidoreductase [Rhizobium sp. BK376]TCR72731.1 NAD(P)-dependent dehydrogenase (short-subunit alcohol dehydrogenase family) [Rhizobium sp. BK376]